MRAARSFPRGTRYSGTQRWDSRPWPPGIVQRRTRRARPPDQQVTVVSGSTALFGRIWNAEAALADGISLPPVAGPTRPSSTTTGWWQTWALTVRARVAIAAGEPDQAERDAQDALTCAAELKAHLMIPDILECLAALAGEDGSHREAARLFGAAHAIRQRMGAVRFKIYDADYHASVAALRDAMGDSDFDSAWAEGAALSTEEAIAYAQRGRGQRKRPTAAGPHSRRPSATSSDWSAKGSPTTTSPQGFSSRPAPCKPTSPTSTPSSALTSRVQLAQEAARHS